MNTTTTSIARVAEKSLPSLSGSSLTYNAEKNVLLTPGYTSLAGNTYYRAFRLSNRLIVEYELGQGYYHTFLNGIRIYCWDNQKPCLIAQRYWGGSNWVTFSEYFARNKSIEMISEFLAGQAKALNQNVSDSEIQNFAQQMFEEAQRKRIA